MGLSLSPGPRTAIAQHQPRRAATRGSRAARPTDDRPSGASSPALAPPLSPRTPLLALGAAALVLSVIVLAVIGPPGALNDPDPAHERAGLLTQGPRLDRLELPGRPLDRQPVLLMFDRRLPDDDALTDLLQDVPDSVAPVLVVAGPPRAAAGGLPDGTAVVVDRQQRIARRVGLRRPRDGGPPVGYAIVDRSAQVRYATLDPAYLEHGVELRTLVRALP